MVKVKIYKNGDSYLGYELSGHSDFANIGEDIVCAGISTLAQTTLIAIEKLVASNLPCEVKSGYLKVTYPKNLTKEQQAKVDLLTKAMELGLLEIEKQYGKNIKITEIS